MVQVLLAGRAGIHRRVHPLVAVRLPIDVLRVLPYDDFQTIPLWLESFIAEFFLGTSHTLEKMNQGMYFIARLY